MGAFPPDRLTFVAAMLLLLAPAVLAAPQNKSDGAKEKSSKSAKADDSKRPADEDDSEEPRLRKLTKVEAKARADEASENDDEDVSPLVRAARSKSGGKSRVSITDEDVENAKGTLIELEQTPLLEIDPENDPQQEAERARLRRDMVSQYDEMIRDQEEKIRNLQIELDGLEEQYFYEDDPASRDGLSVRFDEARKDLEDARAELEKLKEEQRTTQSAQ